MKVFWSIILIVIVVIYIFPLFWMISSSFKTRVEIFSMPPKFFKFDFTLKNYRRVFYKVSGWGKFAREVPSEFPRSLLNSAIITGFSTLLAVILGTLSGYAFSRFEIPGKSDLLFFILSTRMLPSMVIVVPIFVMYKKLHLFNTYHGMIILYIVFNLSFSVWMMKGFIDEIPKEYEEAAMCDGYTRFQAFWKIILPQTYAGIAATAVFCGITAWNEYVFALILTSEETKTVPPTIAGNVLKTTGVNWGEVAAASLIFLVPVIIFTFFVRKYLLRGVTFGTIKG
ncbi:MAG: carbohydrate ABC transporter permease [Thermotoga sp.]|nr:MAG: carbohydrate ABC transporter permease [Thermotoga sp.]